MSIFNFVSILDVKNDKLAFGRCLSKSKIYVGQYIGSFVWVDNTWWVWILLFLERGEQLYIPHTSDAHAFYFHAQSDFYNSHGAWRMTFIAVRCATAGYLLRRQNLRMSLNKVRFQILRNVVLNYCSSEPVSERSDIVNSIILHSSRPIFYTWSYLEKTSPRKSVETW